MYRKKNYFISSITLFPLLISFTQYCDSSPDSQYYDSIPDSLLNMTRDKILVLFSTADIDNLRIPNSLIKDVKQHFAHKHEQIEQWIKDQYDPDDRDYKLYGILSLSSDLPVPVNTPSLGHPPFLHAHGQFSSSHISDDYTNSEGFFSVLGSRVKPSTLVVRRRYWDSTGDSDDISYTSFSLKQCEDDDWGHIRVDSSLSDLDPIALISYQLFKGLPITKTVADRLDYTGTKALNVEVDELEHPHAISIPLRQ